MTPACLTLKFAAISARAHCISAAILLHYGCDASVLVELAAELIDTFGLDGFASMGGGVG